MTLGELLHPLGLDPVSACGVIGLALLLDLVAGEPPAAVHPVVIVGRAIGALRRRAPRRGTPAFLAGLGMVILLGGGAALLCAAGALWLVEVGAPAWLRTALGGLVLWTAFSARLLDRELAGLARALAEPGLEPARDYLPRLCSRDPSTLDAGEIAGAGISSLAENANDSVVAPFFWFALLGLPGAVLFRVVNTLDAMIGYRGEYEWLGKASARTDDLMGFVPARLTAAALLVGGAAGGRLRGVRWAQLAQDAGSTPSPNGGWPMASMAWLLGVCLRKPGVYALCGQGRVPEASDIHLARRLNTASLVIALGPLLGLTAVLAP